MALLDTAIGPLAELIDRIIPDPAAREAAKLELLRLEGAEDLNRVMAEMAPDTSAVIAEAGSSDPWTSRARPAFLYVMYVLLLWSIPMGVIAAIHPPTAAAIARGMHAYLAAIPEPLYALFGTGYLGYTVAREWGKAKLR